MSNSGVSVVVTYHNEGDLLARAVDSILSQQARTLAEVIVVDDASEVRPVLPSAAAERVRLIRSERPLRAAGARNLGIENAVGDYVCFLDADDVYLPDRIDAHAAFLDAHPQVVLAGGQHYVHRETVWLQIPELVGRYNTEMTHVTGVLPDSARWDICLSYPFHTGAITMRRGALAQVGGFRPAYTWGEEWDLQVRLAQIGSIGYIAAPAVRYLEREGSICSTPDPRKHESGAAMCRAWRRSIDDLPAPHRTMLRAREHELRLLAAQECLERASDSGRALKNALLAFECGASVWGMRSLVRTTLYRLGDVVR